LAFALLVHAQESQVCDPASVAPLACAAEPSTGAAVANAPTLPPLRGTLGWVARDELPASRLSTLPEYCDGAYVEPAYTAPLKIDAGSFPTRVQASELQYWLQDRAELRGSVEVTRGNQSLIASHATFDDARRAVTVDDGMLLREPGLLVEGRTAEFMVDTGAARVTDGAFVLHESGLRGSGELLELSDAGDFRVSSGSFTRCEPGNNEWRITTSSVEVEEGAKFGTARHAMLKVHGVPIFYTPYIRFPVTDERMTGWLFPDVGLSDTNGTDVAVPYYLNLAPNYDATLTPRSIAERGTGIEGIARYLSPYANAEVGGSYLPEDNIYDGHRSRDEFEELGLPGEFDPADRWLFTAKQGGYYGDLRTRIDSTKVSDINYFRDFGSNLATSSQVEVQQFGEVVYARDGWSTGLWVQDFQRLDVDVIEPYRRVPEFDFSYQSQLHGPFSWSVDSSWASFERSNDQFVGIDRINGDRLDVEPRVRVPFDWSSAYTYLVSGYRYTLYSLEDESIDAPDDPDRKIWFGSLDSGLFFERDAGLFGASGVQTLEPRVYYLYQQYRDQDRLPEFDVSSLGFTFDQLFRDNRFAGLDRVGDANQLTVALTTRWLDSKDAQELARASIGQILYFEDRRVAIRGSNTEDDRQSTSAVASQVSAAIARLWSIRTNATWDPTDNRWEELGSWIQYRSDGRHIFNIGYRRLDGPLLKQSDISAYWPVARHWSLIGRFNYDYVEHRTIDAFYGLEYNDCCWQIRLFGRNFLVQADNRIAADAESDKGLFFQIVFKGLAGFGGRIDSIMHTGIPGYTAEDY
jgi:LPS-assembly protein